MHSDGGVISSRPQSSLSTSEKRRIEKIKRKAARAIRRAAAVPAAVNPPDSDEPADPVEEGSDLPEEAAPEEVSSFMRCTCTDIDPCTACRFIETAERGSIFGLGEVLEEH